MTQRWWIELFSNYDCEFCYHPSKANVVAHALTRKEGVKPVRVRGMNMTIFSDIKVKILEAQKEAFKEVNVQGEALRGLDKQMEHKTDRQSERTIQTLKDMLRTCVINFRGNWDTHLSVAEFSYNISYHTSIKCAPLEALYGRKCRSPVIWAEFNESHLLVYHALSYALNAIVDVPVVYLQQFWKSLKPVGIVDKVSAFFTKNLAQPWQTMFKFNSIPKRLEEDYHSIKYDVPLVSVYTTRNVTVKGMLILDELLTDDIHETQEYKDYTKEFVRVDVFTIKPQLVESTQGANRTPRATRTPNPAEDVVTIKQNKPIFTAPPPPSDDREIDDIAEATLLRLTLCKAAKIVEEQENVAAVEEQLLKEDVEKIVKGEDEESYASEFVDSISLMKKILILDDDITLVSVHDVNVSAGEEEVVEVINTTKLIVDDAQVSVVGDKVSVVGAATTVSTATTTTATTLGESTTTKSSQQSRDKGKGIMIEEPVKPMKRKDQISFDEENALRLQAEFDEEERLARKKAEKEQEANISLIETWDDIQTKIDADHQLAERLQAQEQEELFVEEKATLFQQLLKKRRKLFAAKRSKERRNKPPIKAQ
ncbi:putative reverse transcriptase domain-containing protein [Tanacetum coccineum]|uniref:Reverse transcriptase domain-containing protein n=1 Tax=Tanacetum coccineum TaxID=301880 RepID=A0ABQ5BDJ1_9ASTR